MTPEQPATGGTDQPLRQCPEAVTLLRIARGFSKRSLAKALNTSTGYVADLETGRRSASAEMLQRIAETLGCPVSMMLASTRIVIPSHRKRRSFRGGSATG